MAEFNEPPKISNGVKYIPLIQNDAQLFGKYFAFWRKDRNKNYIESFAEILKSYFPAEAQDFT